MVTLRVPCPNSHIIMKDTSESRKHSTILDLHQCGFWRYIRNLFFSSSHECLFAKTSISNCSLWHQLLATSDDYFANNFWIPFIWWHQKVESSIGGWDKVHQRGFGGVSSTKKRGVLELLQNFCWMPHEQLSAPWTGWNMPEYHNISLFRQWITRVTSWFSLCPQQAKFWTWVMLQGNMTR